MPFHSTVYRGNLTRVSFDFLNENIYKNHGISKPPVGKNNLLSQFGTEVEKIQISRKKKMNHK